MPTSIPLYFVTDYIFRVLFLISLLIMKAGKWNADWKHRFFVMSGQDLKFYADEQMTKPKGSIDLTTVTDIKAFSSGASGHAWPPPQSRFEVTGALKTYVLSSGDSVSDKHIWLSALTVACQLEEAIEGGSNTVSM